MNITLGKLISQKGWEEFRIKTKIRTSDTYYSCEKMDFEDPDIQKLLPNEVYNYRLSSNGLITWYVQD
jgi:hypothetical protein